MYTITRTKHYRNIEPPHTSLDSTCVFQMTRIAPFPVTLADLAQNEQDDSHGCTQQRENHKKRETVDKSLSQKQENSNSDDNVIKQQVRLIIQRQVNVNNL